MMKKKFRVTVPSMTYGWKTLGCDDIFIFFCMCKNIEGVLVTLTNLNITIQLKIYLSQHEKGLFSAQSNVISPKGESR